MLGRRNDEQHVGQRIPPRRTARCLDHRAAFASRPITGSLGARPRPSARSGRRPVQVDRHPGIVRCEASDIASVVPLDVATSTHSEHAPQCQRPRRVYPALRPDQGDSDSDSTAGLGCCCSFSAEVNARGDDYPHARARRHLVVASKTSSFRRSGSCTTSPPGTCGSPPPPIGADRAGLTSPASRLLDLRGPCHSRCARHPACATARPAG
jgi:hypothetical protein